MSFLLINKTLRLNNLKTTTAMNAKISVFVICVEAIIYLLLYNLHGCTFKIPLQIKCHSEFFWSVFSHIRAEYGKIFRICPYSVQIRENADQKISEYGHFLRSVHLCFEPIFQANSDHAWMSGIKETWKI